MITLNPTMWFSSLPHEWSVFFLSMLPITELRAAIPIGLSVYHLSIPMTWVMAVFGNLVPSFFLLLLLPRLHEWIIRQKCIGPLFKKKLEDAERYFSGNHAKYGAIALVVFVGIPLPMTGAWTGSLASFIFKIPFKKSFPLITLGVGLAATIVTLLTIFAGGAWRALFM
ncbi:MAG: ligand-binding protein SH3 [Candidatus Magasanikbacteria bacterium CG10_big_fil_rev_8_21_14_0_10_42_10]|uniref:Ligand-binding protein SH3 n=2 Tax=Candidatus Magasanikiibacteriota TaxID=1752731 RepID=A0A2H0TWC7_9BACT|nr:MAG: ligand-binding protein SH3 [Candidatus Magasanikbacteria bacterium CG10_big_fil_rev_8_21_14_0_10_42_10]PIZ92757.1 MAG: ligand-binding protein SH3 [Candidatus Magasanikbacteria bacterium CG_4_10_14_0_2_um_filter_41_10]